MGVDTFGKGPPILATPNWSDPATIIASTNFSALGPATNLQTIQPSDRAQSLGVTGGVEVTFDRGEQFPLNLAAMLFGNMTASASWQFQAANTVPALDSAPVIDNAGGFGACLRFNGSAQNGTANGLAWLLVSSFSISARIRAEVLGTLSRGILLFGPAAGTYALVQVGYDGKLHFKRSSGGLDLVSATLAAEYGPWVRVTACYNASTTTASLIINGVLEASASLATFISSPQRVVVAPDDADPFWGWIDDVRIWDYARTPAQEMAELWGELTGVETGLVGYWKFNELSGNNAADSSPGNTTMLLNGTPKPIQSFPERYWTSPYLESVPRTHSLWFDSNMSYMCRYARIRVIDPENTAPFLHWGRCYISAAHQFTKGINYGSSPLGWQDPSTRTELPGGQIVVRRRPTRPISRFRIYSTDENEMYFNLDHARRLRGGSRDVLWVLAPYNEAYRHRSMIYGLDQQENDAPVENYGLWEHSHELVGLT